MCNGIYKDADGKLTKDNPVKSSLELYMDLKTIQKFQIYVFKGHSDIETWQKCIFAHLTL